VSDVGCWIFPAVAGHAFAWIAHAKVAKVGRGQINMQSMLRCGCEITYCGQFALLALPGGS